MEEKTELQKRIDEILFNYDLVDIDENCLNNITGAMIEIAKWTADSFILEVTLMGALKSVGETVNEYIKGKAKELGVYEQK